MTRSLCSLTCKWTYLKQGGWDPAYFRGIGLEDLADGGFEKIGTNVLAPGQPIHGGLDAAAAHHLGLEPGLARFAMTRHSLKQTQKKERI